MKNDKTLLVKRVRGLKEAMREANQITSHQAGLNMMKNYQKQTKSSDYAHLKMIIKRIEAPADKYQRALIETSKNSYIKTILSNNDASEQEREIIQKLDQGTKSDEAFKEHYDSLADTLMPPRIEASNELIGEHTRKLQRILLDNKIKIPTRDKEQLKKDLKAEIKKTELKIEKLYPSKENKPPRKQLGK
jgi:hypothetical protein